MFGIMNIYSAVGSKLSSRSCEFVIENFVSIQWAETVAYRLFWNSRNIVIYTRYCNNPLTTNYIIKYYNAKHA